MTRHLTSIESANVHGAELLHAADHRVVELEYDVRIGVHAARPTGRSDTNEDNRVSFIGRVQELVGVVGAGAGSTQYGGNEESHWEGECSSHHDLRVCDMCRFGIQRYVVRALRLDAKSIRLWT